MPNVNTIVRRWEAGGVLTINESGAQVVKNIMGGSLLWRPLRRTPVMYRDRGVIQTPLEGDDEPTEIEFTVHGGSYLTADLHGILSTTGSTTTGLVNLFDTVVIRIPVARAGATGEDITFTNCWVTERPEVRHGGENELDTVAWKMASASVPVAATF